MEEAFHNVKLFARSISSCDQLIDGGDASLRNEVSVLSLLLVICMSLRMAVISEEWNQQRLHDGGAQLFSVVF